MPDMFDYRNNQSASVDPISGGLNGIKLPESGILSISATEILQFVRLVGKQEHGHAGSREFESSSTTQENDLFRRMSVLLSTQILSLLDVFIFPDSLDAALPASQLHGLALVRSTENRIGRSQGALVSSTVRLSLVCITNLEPSSVKFLQSASRLRCFLHWFLELVREGEAMEGFTAAFNELTAANDRLILAVVLLCHRSLGRCGALLSEIESSSFDKYFETKDSQKKAYRRLLRVVIELRDIVLTCFKGRNGVLSTSLSSSAYEALRACFEVKPASENDVQQSKTQSSKESLARELLESAWVGKFQDVVIYDNFIVPEQLESSAGIDPNSRGFLCVKELTLESKSIIDDFEKGLNGSFEKYLEGQRLWADTGTVRDLEYEGDTTKKRLSGRHKFDVSNHLKYAASKASSAEVRWNSIDRKVSDLWKFGEHSKLPKYTDCLGRRIVLVKNRRFDDHHEANYELLMGREREQEARDREERQRKKKELEDLMKRNSEAIVPYNEEDDPVDHEEEYRDPSSDLQNEMDDSVVQSDLDTTDVETTETNDDEGSIISDLPRTEHDVDAWAKGFIWSDSESVVARFDNVVVVTLQSLVEGKLLLTTHGLYFRQIGREINVLTRQPEEDGDEPQQLSNGPTDRRWRLSRLTEVHGRRYMLRAQALELFFSDSHELFLNFAGGSKDRDKFYAKMRNSCKVRARSVIDMSQHLVFRFPTLLFWCHLAFRFLCFSRQSL